MIKKIIHISDIHIRTFQYHDLYKRQFNVFIQEMKSSLKDYNTEEIRFIITGDLVHQKINISNEQLLLLSWFLNELTTIGYVVIIPGNHDFLENNTDRIDSITPVIQLLDSEQIKYYKDNGVYNDDNINWVVYSLYQHNQKPDFVKDDEKLHIGLFHGPIQGLSTDLGYNFEDGYDKLNFIGCDLVLCGDIHKRQVFNISDNVKGIMIGSFLQQDFWENIKNHGYGVYDVNENEYTFHDLPNEQPFLHFKISDINDIEDGKEILVNS